MKHVLSSLAALGFIATPVMASATTTTTTNTTTAAKPAAAPSKNTKHSKPSKDSKLAGKTDSKAPAKKGN